jgi:diaminopimelate epimerase
MAIDGLHEADIDLHNTVRLKMQDVNKVEYHSGYAILNTGSPHFVKFANNVEDIDVVQTGRDIRYSKNFEKEGINVNFVETTNEDSIFVRTYERGVEDETLSCGTGVTASALMNAHNEKGFNRVEVKTPGGHLSVEFNKIDDEHFNDIWLCGPAEPVYKGEIEI